MPGYLIKAANFVAEIKNDDELKQLAQVDTIKKDTLVRVLPGDTWVQAKTLPLLRKVWGLDAAVVPPPLPGAVNRMTSMPPRLETAIDYRPDFWAKLAEQNDGSNESQSDNADAGAHTDSDGAAIPEHAPQSVGAGDHSQPSSVPTHDASGTAFQAIASNVSAAVDVDSTSLPVPHLQESTSWMDDEFDEEDPGDKTVATLPPKPPLPPQESRDPSTQNLDDVAVAICDESDNIEDVADIAVAEKENDERLYNNDTDDDEDTANINDVVVPDGDGVEVDLNGVENEPDYQDISELNLQIVQDDEKPANIQELDELQAEAEAADAESDSSKAFGENADDLSGIFKGISISDEEDPTNLNDMSDVSGIMFDRMYAELYQENDEAEPDEVTRIIAEYDRPVPPGPQNADVQIASDVQIVVDARDPKDTSNWNAPAASPQFHAVSSSAVSKSAVPKSAADVVQKPEASKRNADAQKPSEYVFHPIPGAPDPVTVLPDAGDEDLDDDQTTTRNRFDFDNFQTVPKQTLRGLATVSRPSSRRSATDDEEDIWSGVPVEPQYPSGARSNTLDWTRTKVRTRRRQKIDSASVQDAMSDDSPTGRVKHSRRNPAPEFAGDPSEMPEELRAARAAVEAAKQAVSQNGELSSTILKRAALLVDALEVAHTSGVYQAIDEKDLQDDDSTTATGVAGFRNLVTGDRIWANDAKSRKKSQDLLDDSEIDRIPEDYLDESPSEKFQVRSRQDLARLVQKDIAAERQSGKSPRSRKDDDLVREDYLDESPSEMFQVRSRKELEHMMRREMQRDRSLCARSSEDDEESSSDRFKIRGGSMVRRMMAEEARAMRTDSQEIPAPDLSATSNADMRRMFQQADELHLVLAHEIRDKESSVAKDMDAGENQDAPYHSAQIPEAGGSPQQPAADITDDLPVRNEHIVAVSKPKEAPVTVITTTDALDRTRVPQSEDDAFFKDKLEPGEQLIAQFDTLYLTSRRLWNIRGRKYVSSYESYDIQDVQCVALKEERKWGLMIAVVILTVIAGGAYVFYPRIELLAVVIYGVIMCLVCLIVFFRTTIQIGLQGGMQVRSEIGVTRKNRVEATTFLNHVDATRLTRRRQLGI